MEDFKGFKQCILELIASFHVIFDAKVAAMKNSWTSHLPSFYVITGGEELDSPPTRPACLTGKITISTTFSFSWIIPVY